MDIRRKKKIALVLGGGGIKAAAFHIGVCLALKQKGFKFAGGPVELTRHKFPDNDPMTIRMYIGSSAGAFIASVLAAGFDVESLVNAFQVGSGSDIAFSDQSIRYLKPLNYRHIFHLSGSNLWKFFPTALLKKSVVTGGIEALLKNTFKMNGLFSTRGLEKYLRENVLVDNEFHQLGVGLYIIATQLNHTRQAVFGPFKESTKTSSHKFINYSSISDAVACSSALPPVFAPYPITRPDGKELYFYDGEIRNTLSAGLASELGADLVLASYSVQPYHFTPEMGSLHEYGIPVLLNQALYQVIQQKISRSIDWQSAMRQIYKSVDQFFIDKKLPEQDRLQLLEIIRQRLNYRPEVDFLYIAPRPQNYEMFFIDHFSLNPQILEKIVRFGFKSAFAALKQWRL